MVHNIGLKGLGQFRQYVDDDAQRCHFVHDYEDRLTDDEYQWSERIYLTYNTHLPNPFWKSREKVGYKGERERRVLTAEGSDTKLRMIRRLDLLVSQYFLYICVRQYTIVMVEITT
jgi:hypothetical protein